MTTIQTRWLLPLNFFIFISYIIFLADTADYNFAFKIVGHIPYGDKMCHALLYGIMAFLLNYGLGFRRVGIYRSVYLGNAHLGGLENPPYMGSIVVLTFAILEECSQYYIPSRTFDLWDLGADFVGVFLFSFVRSKKWHL